MVTRSTLLSTTAIAALALALAGCNSSNDGLATLAEEGDPGPLGLTFETAVNVMSSDREDGNTVRVRDDLATIELVSFDPVALTFEIALQLPDSSSVTLTDQNIVGGLGGIGIGPGNALHVVLENDNGDEVGVIIGLGMDTDPNDLVAADADKALFALAGVDPDGDDPDLGVDTYMVTGVETDPNSDNLASGWAEYTGVTIASIYVDGELVNDHVNGSASVVADFDNSQVDIKLDGSYSEVVGPVLMVDQVMPVLPIETKYEYALFGEDIPVEGSRYSGALGVAGFLDDTLQSEFVVSNRPCLDGCGDGVFSPVAEIDLAGDVIGAFYGAEAEATAGVFGAEETNLEDYDVEIVGGFAAYAENADTLAPPPPAP